MQVQIRKLEGSWDLGYAPHKHTFFSVLTGYNEYGYPQFDTKRSEPGEALYQLKYREDWGQVPRIVAQLQTILLPLFENIGLIIPTPASKQRVKQPVDELANELGRITGIPVFGNITVKSAAPQGSQQLKKFNTREEKDEALDGRFSVNPCITNNGSWNALLLDDLFDTGATLNAICKVLRTYSKINRIHVSTVNLEVTHDNSIYRRIDFHYSFARESARENW